MPDRKTWLAILGIVVLISGLLIFLVFRGQQTERNLRIQKEQALIAKTAELTQVQAQLADLKKQKEDLENKLEDALALQEFAQEEHDRLTANLNQKIASLAKEKESLTQYVGENTQNVKKLSEKIDRLERDKKQLMQTIQEMKDQKAAAAARRNFDVEEEPEDTDVQQKTSQPDVVDLGQIIVRKSTQQAAQVENVNALWGFIVISAGSDDGLKTDSLVNISRNDRFIAKAIVKKVRPNISTAVTLPEWTREEIKPGDLVSLGQHDR